MQVSELREALGPALSAALKTKGYDTLTAVQQAVLDPSLAVRDLRITSQTGSGKTLAIGLVLRPWIEGLEGEHKPRALIICPTRELALQSQAELSWLYAGLNVRVVATTGGAGYRDELRALHRSPTVIVGTPGRLLDHLGRGAVDASEVRAVVLDEADRMLDLGFREDIEAILKHVPKERRTHLVSATFARGVKLLADKVQRDPAHVEGTRLGAANADIDHVIHLIEPKSTVDAIINLLLATPDAQTLIFARTRASVASLAELLSSAGFSVATLSGELDQAARNRALAAFKAKHLDVLVATDVAARGIDVQDIARVIHAEPPRDADSYTHRSGRTGRAGKRGVSSLLVTPAGIVPATRLLRMAGVAHRVEPIPTADQIRRDRDRRVLEELTREPDATDPISAGDGDPRLLALAAQVLSSAQPERAVARLLARARAGGVTEPREIRPPMPPPRPGQMRGRDYPAHGSDPRDRYSRGPRDRDARDPRDRDPRDRDPRGNGQVEQGFTRFHVTWGERQGAAPHRLLAMLCKRGGVSGRDIGAITVEANFSLVDVASEVAPGFAQAVSKPDPRDPHVRVRPDRGPTPHAQHAPPARNAQHAPREPHAPRAQQAPHAQRAPSATRTPSAPRTPPAPGPRARPSGDKPLRRVRPSRELGR
jgi:ATP-dependent RNA helicase DeaD